MNGKEKVLAALKDGYHPYTASFYQCIAQEVGLSEQYTRQLLNELVAEGKVKSYRSYGTERCYQYRPEPAQMTLFDNHGRRSFTRKSEERGGGRRNATRPKEVRP